MNKINNFNTQHTSLLSWSLSASHSRPDVAEYNNRMNTIEAGLNTTLQRLEFNNSYNSLLRYLMPSCEEFVLECSLQEGQNINGSTCCEEFFNPEPILNQHGNYFWFLNMNYPRSNFMNNVSQLIKSYSSLYLKGLVLPPMGRRPDTRWRELGKETPSPL